MGDRERNPKKAFSWMLFPQKIKPGVQWDEFMTDDKWSFWSKREKNALQFSIPWEDAVKELYKNYSKKDIFNFMETGELSYAVNLIDETKPHGLDALWLYGSDRLEDFLRDYNIWFYRDSLSDILWKKSKIYSDSETANEIPNPSVKEDPCILQQLKKIQVGYDNESEFRIKIPGKSIKQCCPDDLGCRNEKTTQFRLLLSAIERDNIYLSDHNKRKTFKRACEKLVGYIKKSGLSLLPAKTKIYEKDLDGNYRLIFSRLEDDIFEPNGKYGKMSNDQLLAEIGKLQSEMDNPPQHIKNNSSLRKWQERKSNEISNACKIAMDNGTKKEEIENLICKKTDHDTVVELFEDEKIEQSSYNYENDGLSIKNEP